MEVNDRIKKANAIAKEIINTAMVVNKCAKVAFPIKRPRVCISGYKYNRHYRRDRKRVQLMALILFHTAGALGAAEVAKILSQVKVKYKEGAKKTD